MTEQEAGELIDTVARHLGITELMTSEYHRELYEESGGPPYVIKILLGEVAKERRARKPSRIIADQEHILQALFERTYSVLTPAAQRVFPLLSSWRSIVPTLGVEAVVIHNAEERIDVRAAIDELERQSFIEERTASEGEESFLSVPLAASSFGRRKLNTSVPKVSIETDLELLQTFGAARKENVRSGVRPRILRLIKRLAEVHALIEMADMPGIKADELSRSADTVNRLLAAAKREGRQLFQTEERKYLIGKLAAKLEQCYDELDATDLAQLAWLHLHLNNEARAGALVMEGLKLDPDNEHCLSLAAKGIG
jgi:hypothetical protein